MIVRDASAGDVVFVCRNLCAEDAREQFACAFAGEATPEHLAAALAAAREAAIAHFCLAADDGEAVALTGAWLQSPKVATIHQVRTDRWPEIGRDAHRFYRRHFIPFVLEPNVRLAECRVLADQAAVVRWMATLGFTPNGAALPYGSRGEPLVHLVWRNPTFGTGEV